MPDEEFRLQVSVDGADEIDRLGKRFANMARGVQQAARQQLRDIIPPGIRQAISDVNQLDAAVRGFKTRVGAVATRGIVPTGVTQKTRAEVESLARAFERFGDQATATKIRRQGDEMVAVLSRVDQAVQRTQEKVAARLPGLAAGVGGPLAPLLSEGKKVQEQTALVKQQLAPVTALQRQLNTALSQGLIQPATLQKMSTAVPQVQQALGGLGVAGGDQIQQFVERAQEAAKGIAPALASQTTEIRSRLEEINKDFRSIGVPEQQKQDLLGLFGDELPASARETIKAIEQINRVFQNYTTLATQAAKPFRGDKGKLITPKLDDVREKVLGPLPLSEQARKIAEAPMAAFTGQNLGAKAADIVEFEKLRGGVSDLVGSMRPLKVAIGAGQGALAAFKDTGDVTSTTMTKLLRLVQQATDVFGAASPEVGALLDTIGGKVSQTSNQLDTFRATAKNAFDAAKESLSGLRDELGKVSDEAKKGLPSTSQPVQIAQNIVKTLDTIQTKQGNIPSLPQLDNMIKQLQQLSQLRPELNLGPATAQFQGLRNELANVARTAGSEAAPAFEQEAKATMSAAQEGLKFTGVLREINDRGLRAVARGGRLTSDSVQGLMAAFIHLSQTPGIPPQLREQAAKAVGTLQQLQGSLEGNEVRLKAMNREAQGMPARFGAGAQSMLLLQSASQGAMLGFSLLRRNIQGVGFSLIFLRFGAVRVALAAAVLTLTLGGLGKLFASLLTGARSAGAALQDLRFQVTEMTGSVKETKAFMDLFDESTRRFGFAADDSKEALIKLRNEGLLPNLEALHTIQDFARATGQTFSQAASLVTQAVGRESGNLQSLGDVMGVIPEIFNKNLNELNNTLDATDQKLGKSGLTRPERFQFVLDLLAKYKGAANDYARTATGAFSRVKEAWAGLSRDLTEPIARDVLAPFLNAVANLINKISEAVRAFKGSGAAIRLWNKLLANMKEAFQILFPDFDSFSTGIGNLVAHGLLILLKLLVVLSELFILFARAIRAAANAIKYFLELIKPLIDLLRRLAQMLKALNFRSLFSDIKDVFVNFGAGISALVHPIEHLAVPALHLLMGVLKGVIDGSTPLGKALRGTFEDVGRIFRGAADDIDTGVEDILKAFRKGRFAKVLRESTDPEEIDRILSKMGRSVEHTAEDVADGLDNMLRGLRRAAVAKQLREAVDQNEIDRILEDLKVSFRGTTDDIVGEAERLGSRFGPLVRRLKAPLDEMGELIARFFRPTEIKPGEVLGPFETLFRGLGGLGGILRFIVKDFTKPLDDLHVAFQKKFVFTNLKELTETITALPRLLAAPLETLPRMLGEGLFRSLRMGFRLAFEALTHSIAALLDPLNIGVVVGEILTRILIEGFLPDQFKGYGLIVSDAIWGAINGAIVGAAVGEAVFPLGGGIPGAIIGALVGVLASIGLDILLDPRVKKASEDIVNSIGSAISDAFSSLGISLDLSALNIKLPKIDLPAIGDLKLGGALDQIKSLEGPLSDLSQSLNETTKNFQAFGEGIYKLVTSGLLRDMAMIIGTIINPQLLLMAKLNIYLAQIIIGSVIIAFNQIVDILTGQFGPAVQITVGFIQLLLVWLNLIVVVVSNVVGLVGNILKGDWAAAWKSVKNLAMAPINDFIGSFEASVKIIIGIAESMWVLYKNSFELGAKLVIFIIKQLMIDIVDLFVGLPGRVVDAISSLGTALTKLLDDTLKQVFDIKLSDVIQGFADNAFGLKTTVTDTINKLPELSDTLKQKLGELAEKVLTAKNAGSFAKYGLIFWGAILFPGSFILALKPDLLDKLGKLAKETLTAENAGRFTAYALVFWLALLFPQSWIIVLGAKFREDLQEFVSHIPGWVATAAISAGSAIADAAQFLWQGLDDIPVGAVITALTSFASNLPGIIASSIGGVGPALETTWQAIFNPGALIGWLSIQLTAVVVSTIPGFIASLAGELQKFVTETLPKWVDGISSYLTDNFKPWEWIKQAVLDFIGGFIGGLGDIFGSGFVTGWLERLKNYMIQNFQPWEWIKGALGTFFGEATSLLGGLIQTIISQFGRLPVEVPGQVAAMAGAVLGGLAGLANDAGGKAWEVGTRIANMIQSGLGYPFSWGWNLVSGLWDGIESRSGWLFDKVWNFAKDIFGKIKDGLADLWPGSPSKAGIKVGEGLGEGIAKGIRNSAGEIATAVGGAVAKVMHEVGVLQKPLTVFPDTVMPALKRVPEVGKDVVTEAAQKTRQVAGSFDLNGINFDPLKAGLNSAIGLLSGLKGPAHDALDSLSALSDQASVTAGSFVHFAVGLITTTTGLQKTFTDVFNEIEGILGAFATLIENTFKNLPRELATAVSKIVPAVVDGFAEIGAQVGRSVGGLATDVVGIFTSLAGDLVQPLTSLFTTVVGWFGSIWNALLGAGGSVIQLVTDIPAKFGELKTGILTIITNAVPDLVKAAAGLGLSIMDGIVSGLEDGVTQDARAFGVIIGTIKSFFLQGFQIVGNIANLMLDVGSALIDGILQGAKDALPTAGDAISWIAGRVVGFFKGAFGIGSPATTMVPVGSDLMAGVQQGINQGLPGANITADSAAGSIVGSFDLGIQSRIEGIKGNADRMIAEFVGQQEQSTYSQPIQARLQNIWSILNNPNLTPEAKETAINQVKEDLKSIVAEGAVRANNELNIALGITPRLLYGAGGEGPGLALGGRIIKAARGASLAMAMVGEQGKEIIAAPVGSQVLSHTQTLDMLHRGADGGANQTVINVTVQGNVVGSNGMTELAETITNIQMKRIKGSFRYTLNRS